MPDYAWKCQFCDFRETIFKPFAAEWVIPICPECNTEMRRDYRISGVHFKGSGFYKTDK